MTRPTGCSTDVDAVGGRGPRARGPAALVDHAEAPVLRRLDLRVVPTGVTEPRCGTPIHRLDVLVRPRFGAELQRGFGRVVAQIPERIPACPLQLTLDDDDPALRDRFRTRVE